MLNKFANGDRLFFFFKIISFMLKMCVNHASKVLFYFIIRLSAMEPMHFFRYGTIPYALLLMALFQFIYLFFNYLCALNVKVYSNL